MTSSPRKMEVRKGETKCLGRMSSEGRRKKKKKEKGT